MTDLYYPLRSLREGHWFKLICGASFQHLPAVRSLTLAYALAGVDCIDVAADPAVIFAAKSALEAASRIVKDADNRYRHLPWLMVSFNDGEDPHFRKAEFTAADCPPDCPRPCETICPAQAISFQLPRLAAEGLQDSFGRAEVNRAEIENSGVISDRCYGCGRCIPICPVQHISTRSYVSTPAAIAPLILQTGIDAIEIHTQIGHLADFQRLWCAVSPWVNQLKLVAISCPDGEGLIDYLRAIYEVISPLPCSLVWQTDGRPMSGDIGVGATRATVRLGQKVLAAELPGYVQLAGGTNHHTVPKLKALGLLNQERFGEPFSSLTTDRTDLSDSSRLPYIAGIAYGSYARTLLLPVLNQLEAIEREFPLFEQPERSLDFQTLSTESNLLMAPVQQSPVPKPIQVRLEDRPELLWEAVGLANSLVSQLKSSIVSKDCSE